MRATMLHMQQKCINSNSNNNNHVAKLYKGPKGNFYFDFDFHIKFFFSIFLLFDFQFYAAFSHFNDGAGNCSRGDSPLRCIKCATIQVTNERGEGGRGNVPTAKIHAKIGKIQKRKVKKKGKSRNVGKNVTTTAKGRLGQRGGGVAGVQVQRVD